MKMFGSYFNYANVMYFNYVNYNVSRVTWRKQSMKRRRRETVDDSVRCSWCEKDIRMFYSMASFVVRSILFA